VIIGTRGAGALLSNPASYVDDCCAAPADRIAKVALGADDHLSKRLHPPSSSSVPGAPPPSANYQVPRLGPAVIELDQIARTAGRDGRQLDLLTNDIGVLKALLMASPIPGKQKSHESGDDASPTRVPA
jgi:hypothetical protein